jgi:microcystin-dependent protein
MKIDLIFLIVLCIIIIYTYCNCNNIKEKFDDTPVYDIESNRNLASIALKLMTSQCLDVRGNINFKGMIKVNGTDILPIGSIIAYSGSKIPRGWVWCNGGDISRGYPELVAVLGKTSLPDLRGRAIIGAGTGTGLTDRPLGSTGGEETHTLTVDEIPSHNHALNTLSHYHNLYYSIRRLTGSTNAWYTDGPAVRNENTDAQTDMGGNHNHTMTAEGGGQAHNNMQPYLGLNYIIRAK